MNASPQPATPTATRWSRVGPWVWLGAAVCWSVAIRVPLIVNAAVHLDSDLAVDGLTLMQAVQGRWRWHYPGTPHMGIAPVLLSWVQARIWGADSVTLVSGGTVAYVLVMLTTFALGWRVYGRSVAVWSLVPLCFASTGSLWLSGRITGGHLPVLAWSAGGLAALASGVDASETGPHGLAGALVRFGYLPRFDVSDDSGGNPLRGAGRSLHCGQTSRKRVSRGLRRGRVRARARAKDHPHPPFARGGKTGRSPFPFPRWRRGRQGPGRAGSEGWGAGWVVGQAQCV